MRVSFKSLLLLLVPLIALVLYLVQPPQEAIAFNHSWSNVAVYTNGVTSYGLWDDIAAGDAPSGNPAKVEAGLLWFANQPGSQMLAYHTYPKPVNAGTYPILTVRAAVSDSSTLRVVAYEPLGDNHICDQAEGAAASVEWTANDATGYYKSLSVNLANVAPVEEICIFLNKTANNVTGKRSNALIDSITIHDAGGAIGWTERFTGNP